MNAKLMVSGGASMGERLNSLISSKKKKLAVIRRSSFFDSEWYKSQNPDVESARIDPALHFLKHGATEGRDPSMFFSTSEYIKRFPVLEESGENPLVHFESRRDNNLPRPRKRTSTQFATESDYIPKLFHNVWLSGDEIPAPLSLGVTSFLTHNPDFKAMTWCAEDFLADGVVFFSEALKRKKWAFATDYVRLKTLYEYGGVYADGDVAFYSNINEYMQYDCVICWENHFAVGPHFLMAKPRSEFIGRLLDIYCSREFIKEGRLDLTPIPVIATWILTTEFGLCLDGSRQLLRGNLLVESEGVFTTNFNDNTCIAEHLYFCGWTSGNEGSYRDELIAIASRWASENDTPLIRKVNAFSTKRMKWAYYFSKNAERAFPAIQELSTLESFRALKARPIGSRFIKPAKVLALAQDANPLKYVSKWHLKEEQEPLALAKNITETGGAVTGFYPDFGSSYKVSVVVPVYNVSQYLRKCLASIQMQSYSNIEVIIVDDGSTDGSSSIAQAVCDNDTRFKYFRKENGGLGEARNFAIPYLSSDLVTFVDSDDYLDCNHLLKLQEMFRQGHDLAICNFRLTTPDGRCIETRNLAKFWGETDPVTHALISGYECYAWNKMYTTETFTGNENARYSKGWFEDFALTPALIAGSKNIGFVDEPTYNYVQRPGSILSDARKNVSRNREVFDALRMFMRHRDIMPEYYFAAYMQWVAPKHYFYWRVIAILNERSHSVRVSAARDFSIELNLTVPEWTETKYIETFVREPTDPAHRMARQDLVDAFRSNNLAFYARMESLAACGLST